MQIIPVVDLANGIVVHARRGERARYAPLVTPLAASAAPLDVIDGMLAFHPFTALYIADLDAIAGGPGHLGDIAAIARRHPRLRLLLDAGFASPRSLAPYVELPTVDFVLGSESIACLADYAVLLATATPRRCVLSLDRDAAGPRGCAELFAQPDCWPQRVIHMTLTQVGSEAGPDWAGLASLRAIAGGRDIYAAGGVRDDTDLVRLADGGVAGALVATALHAGRISRSHC